MPYSSVSEVPTSVSKAKRRQWMAVWNASYKEHKDEARAFAAAWAAIGSAAWHKTILAWVTKTKTGIGNGWMFGEEIPGEELPRGYFVKAVGTAETGFVRAVEGPFKCGNCAHMDGGNCTQAEVIADPEVKDLLNAGGLLPVNKGDCCNEFDPKEKAKAMTTKFKKFI